MSIARFAVIGREPTKLSGGTPGCRESILFQEKACFFYRSRPGGKTIGPVCLDAEKGEGSAKVDTIYEIWGKDSTFIVTIVPQP